MPRQASNPTDDHARDVEVPVMIRTRSAGFHGLIEVFKILHAGRMNTNLIAVGLHLTLVYSAKIASTKRGRTGSVVHNELQSHQLIHVECSMIAVKREHASRQEIDRRGAYFLADAACLAVGAVCSQSMYLLLHATILPSMSDVQSLLLCCRRIRIPDAILAKPRRSLQYRYQSVTLKAYRGSLTGYPCIRLNR